MSRVTAILPQSMQDPSAIQAKRMSNLVQYAKKVEDDMYRTAASKVSILSSVPEIFLILFRSGFKRNF